MAVLFFYLCKLKNHKVKDFLRGQWQEFLIKIQQQQDG